MYGSKIFEYMSMKIKLIFLHVFEQKQQQERSSNNFGSLWFVAHTVDFYIWKKVQRGMFDLEYIFFQSLK